MTSNQPNMPQDPSPPKVQTPQLSKSDEDPAALRNHRRRPMRCFHCNKPGHLILQCQGKKRGTSPTCFHCNKSGHIILQCPEKTRGASPACFHCNRPGHLSRQCPDKARKIPPTPPGATPEPTQTTHAMDVNNVEVLNLYTP